MRSIVVTTVVRSPRESGTPIASEIHMRYEMFRTHTRDMTRETAPWHVFNATVREELASLKLGIDTDAIDATEGARERIQQAYQAGEPLWMVADEIQIRVRARMRAERIGDGTSRGALLAPYRSGK